MHDAPIPITSHTFPLLPSLFTFVAVIMTDEGGFSVWGAEKDEELSKPSVNSLIPAGPSKRTPTLYGDLAEDEADWGIQLSSPPRGKDTRATKELTEEPSLSPPSSSPAFQPPSASYEDSEGDVREQGEEGQLRPASGSFDEFGDSEFAEAGAVLDGDDDFGAFGDFEEEEEQSGFEEPETIVAEEAGPSREWVSTPVNIHKLP
jgi:hypothetical protein